MANLTEEIVHASTLAHLDSAVRALKSTSGLSAWPEAERRWFVSLLNVRSPDDFHLVGGAEPAPSYAELLLQPIFRDLASGSDPSGDNLKWMLQFCQQLLLPEPRFAPDDTDKATKVMMQLRRSIIRHRMRSRAQHDAGNDLF
jgi:hypothetical protein